MPTPKAKATKATKTTKSEKAVKKPRVPKHMSDERLEELESKPTDSLTRKEKLALITERKRRLAEEQKALRAELNESRGERSEARKERATARRSANEAKKALGLHTVTVGKTLKGANPDEINELADAITEHATTLASELRKYAGIVDTLDEL